MYNTRRPLKEILFFDCFGGKKIISRLPHSRVCPDNLKETSLTLINGNNQYLYIKMSELMAMRLSASSNNGDLPEKYLS